MNVLIFFMMWVFDWIKGFIFFKFLLFLIVVKILLEVCFLIMLDLLVV